MNHTFYNKISQEQPREVVLLSCLSFI